MKMMRKTFAAGVLAAALLLTGCSNATLDTVQASAAYELTQDSPSDLVVLDIRTQEEFAEGHLEDAIMIDFYSPDFQAQLDQLDKDAPYLVYCRSGNRSAQAMPIFKSLGFQEVYEVDGGIVSWYREGLPISSS